MIIQLGMFQPCRVFLYLLHLGGDTRRQIGGEPFLWENSIEKNLFISMMKMLRLQTGHQSVFY